MNKVQLKKLIKEVIREAETMSAPPSSIKPDSGLKHSAEFEKKKGDTLLKLHLKGLKPGRAYKDFMAKVAHDAKMRDLDIVHAELEKSGKTVASMDAAELKSVRGKVEPEDKFNTSTTKSITSRTSKEKPPMKGGPEDWQKATDKDVVDTREKTKLKNAKIASGTYDPNDTSLWTDKEWDAWEQKDRARDPKGWSNFDATIKGLP